MPTLRIVPVVKERGNRALRLAVRMEVARRQEFMLECGEEAFGDGVVPAIPTATHARHHAVREQRRAIVVTGVLPRSVLWTNPAAG